MHMYANKREEEGMEAVKREDGMRERVGEGRGTNMHVHEQMHK